MSMSEHTDFIMSRTYTTDDQTELLITLHGDGKVVVSVGGDVGDEIVYTRFIFTREQWSRLTSDMSSVRYMLDREERERENARKNAQELEVGTQVSHIDDIVPNVTD